MNRTQIIFLLITSLFLFSFCKNNKPENETDKDTNSEKIELYSSHEELFVNPDNLDYTAFLSFKPDGQTEYISTKPSEEFQTTTSGLEYKFIERNSNTRSVKVGDVIILSLKYTNENDSVIFESEAVDSNFKMRVAERSHRNGSIEEAYLMLNKGDSAIFKIDAENFYIYTQKRINIPDYVKAGQKLIFYIRIKDVLSGEDFISKHSDLYQHHLQQERSMIERFLMGVDFDIKRYESGLVHIVIDEGSGNTANLGQTVKIDYIASFIDGAPFDSSLDRNEPFEFRTGANEVIDGLEQAVLNMRIGEYALIIIPFRLAYGEERTGIIPPFSTLVFEVELLDAN